MERPAGYRAVRGGIPVDRAGVALLYGVQPFPVNKGVDGPVKTSSMESGEQQGRRALLPPDEWKSAGKATTQSGVKVSWGEVMTSP
eukprot:753291-Rhodomonas_salina.1